MRIFVDTSSLFKKYVEESGSGAFEKLMTQATEIVVAPVTWIEMNAAIERQVRSHFLFREHAEWLQAEAKRDFTYFVRVVWNENLEAKAVELISKHTLKTMDAVQLASGILSKTELFVTSDPKLYREAKSILQHARLI